MNLVLKYLGIITFMITTDAKSQQLIENFQPYNNNSCTIYINNKSVDVNCDFLSDEKEDSVIEIEDSNDNIVIAFDEPYKFSSVHYSGKVDSGIIIEYWNGSNWMVSHALGEGVYSKSFDMMVITNAFQVRVPETYTGSYSIAEFKLKY